MTDSIIGFILLIISGLAFLIGILWTISWINQLALFMMKIYKNEKAELETRYCTLPAVYLALTFVLYHLSKIFLSF